jgi:signal transduction histidine kinase
MAAASYRFRSAAHQGDLSRAGGKTTSFPLLRWFALLSAVAVLFVWITGTLFLNRFVERVSLLQSADGLTGLINSIVEVEQADRFFLRNGQDGSNDFNNFLVHLGKLPGVLRANVYSRDGLVLWSSDPALIGQRFSDNDELNTALAGTSVVSAGSIGEDHDKAEHVDLAEPGNGFVENYLPVWSMAGGVPKVVGAIEVYRRPVQLLAAIQQTQMQIWWSALAVTLLLYAALCGIVARAACVMRLQQMALVAAEKLALAGEMASAVAHGLRNPLASIRSTAELGLETEDRREVRGLLAEVVSQSDRLEGWIRQFLTTARAGSSTQTPTDARAVIVDCAKQFEPTLARRGMLLETALQDNLPKVHVCPIILRQILNSVLANAIEAMAVGGRLSIDANAVGRSIAIKVGDTGIGMSARELETALEPFATTKSQGLGLGLPLARETIARHGGSLHLESQAGTGTTVYIILPAAASPRAAELGA